MARPWARRKLEHALLRLAEAARGQTVIDTLSGALQARQVHWAEQILYALVRMVGTGRGWQSRYTALEVSLGSVSMEHRWGKRHEVHVSVMLRLDSGELVPGRTVNLSLSGVRWPGSNGQGRLEEFQSI